MEHQSYQYSLLPLLILLFPLCGFLMNGVVIPIFQRGFAKNTAAIAGSVASFFIALSFVGAVMAFTQLQSGANALVFDGFTWLKIQGHDLRFALNIDHLSVLLVLLITGVGTLIHLYSIGYMSHEKSVGRYFSYLNLFCHAMLLLVLGKNLVLLFFGWEGVGLCSYLLIGFWYSDTEKANAGKKAFIANRVGDLSFLMGLFLIWKNFGTFDFYELREKMLGIGEFSAADYGSLFTIIGLLLFGGATGKSAQIPLFVWLPDAMSGPTPVSALIHAATMVTAGVYMLVRMNYLYELAPSALQVVAWVGVLTALLAGTIALAQRDIKKVLAYSTVSQLGFMFLACGVGAYQTAIFHLLTHAFFKALLFLGSGSVIHAYSGEQDMLEMGGAKKYLPHTYFTMMVGSLAISGIPFFAGFFSKDEILYSTIALPGGQLSLFWVAILVAVMTAFYTARMMALTFLGSERTKHDVLHHVHESPIIMLIPLYVLAFLAAFGGFLGVPHVLGQFLGHMPHWLSGWLSPLVPTRHLPEAGVHLSLSEPMAMVFGSSLAIIAFSLGIRFFKEKKNHFLTDLLPAISPLHKLWENKYWVDEIYAVCIINPVKKLSKKCAEVIDRLFVDGLVNAMGSMTVLGGQWIKKMQNGDVRSYAVGMILGVAVIFLLLTLQVKVMQ